jgi:hypothetical protein
MMDITHAHGFGCSAPMFKDLEDLSMTFVIGTFLPSIRSKNKYVNQLLGCLFDIREFSILFLKQLDFNLLDLSMFEGVDLNVFYPEQLAAVRDQHYGGSWEVFKKAMQMEQRLEEVEIIQKCQEFEGINKKDIGLVGHKLNYILNMLDENLGNDFGVN